MTVKTYALNHLVSSGLSSEDAIKVFNRTIANPENSTMAGRWDDNIDEYPPLIKSIITINVNSEALKWCNEHCPEAWFKPVFMTKAQREEIGLDF